MRNPIDFENKLLHNMNSNIKQKKFLKLAKSNKDMSIKDLPACREPEQRQRHRDKRERGRRQGRLEDRLTDSDCSHHWRHNDRESHSTSDHQVPLVVGNIFAFVAVMDLREKGSNVSQREETEESNFSSHSQYPN